MVSLSSLGTAMHAASGGLQYTGPKYPFPYTGLGIILRNILDPVPTSIYWMALGALAYTGSVLSCGILDRSSHSSLNLGNRMYD